MCQKFKKLYAISYVLIDSDFNTEHVLCVDQMIYFRGRNFVSLGTRQPLVSKTLFPANLYLGLRNQRDILPLQQNPPQLSLRILLQMNLHRIVDHQIHKFIESLHKSVLPVNNGAGRRTLILPSMR